MNIITTIATLLFCLSPLHLHAAPLTVLIGNTDQEFSKLQQPEDLECGVLTVSESPSRAHVEMYLFARALHVGGLKFRIRLLDTANYSRSVLEARQGNVTTVGQTVWRADADPDRFHVSTPLLKDGDMVKVLYTSPDNKNALATRTPEDVRGLCAAISPHWRRDVEMLEEMGVQCVEHTTQFKAMLRLVSTQRVDFVALSPTCAKDMSYSWQSFLIPIPGVKAVVHGTRHFVVSKDAPQAEAIFAALERGLSSLRKSGEIRRLYRKAGLFNPKVENWTPIN